MKIKMILTNAFSIDVRVYKEAKYLVSQGHKVEILCWDKTPEKGLPANEEMDGIKIRRFAIPAVEGSGYRQIGAYLAFIRKCRTYLRKRRYDALHCHDMDGAIVGWLIGSKFVFDMHEFYDKGGRVRRILSHHIVCHLVKKAKAIVYVSGKSLDTYGRGCASKFYLLRNYCDASMYGNVEKIPSEDLRIAYIGRVRNQIKEFSALFKAVKGIPNVVVNIYGGGPDLEQLRVMAKGIDNVVIHGEFNGVKDSEWIYRNTDLSFVAYDPTNPNYQGDFEPVKLYEAIVTGTPVLATKGLNPGIEAENLEIGLAVDTRSGTELRGAILALLDNRDKILDYKKKMSLIASQYDWNEAVRVLNGIYSML